MISKLGLCLRTDRIESFENKENPKDFLAFKFLREFK